MKVSRFLLVLLPAWIVLCGFGHLAIAGDYTVPKGLESADPDWLASWQYEIDRQVEEISSAYGLDADSAESLRGELMARLLQQQQHDSQGQSELEKLQQQMADQGVSPDDADHPLVKQFNDKFMNWMSSMPLGETQVADWVDTTLPPEMARSGRIRYDEIRELRLQREREASFDQQRAAGTKASISQEAASLDAELDVNYNRPVPTSDLAERVEAMDRLNRVARHIEPTRGHRDAESMQQSGVPQIEPPKVVHQPVAAQPAANDDVARATPPQSSPPRPVVSDPNRDRMGAGLPPAQPVAKPAAPEPPPQPAPPLDEWEKYVLATADKYGFDDAQLTNARSILSDLRRRAYQYQTSRAEAFARVELMTDAKAREVEKKALNKPLDALFAELKSRLESLPTQSQRQKAGQPARK